MGLEKLFVPWGRVVKQPQQTQRFPTGEDESAVTFNDNARLLQRSLNNKAFDVQIDVFCSPVQRFMFFTREVYRKELSRGCAHGLIGLLDVAALHVVQTPRVSVVQ